MIHPRMRSAATVLAVAASALLVLAAYASEGSAERLAQPVPSAGGPSAFGSGGNPTPLGNLQPRHNTTDITFDTGRQPFSFQRFYSNTSDSWSFESQTGDLKGILGEPFGRVAKTSKSDGGIVRGMLWWHNLYAFVKYVKLACTGGYTGTECNDPHFVVRDLGGASFLFIPSREKDCDEFGLDPSGAGCMMTRPEGARGYRLQRTTLGYTLFRPDGLRLQFETPVKNLITNTDHFLTRIEASGAGPSDGSGAQQILALRYGAPGNCGTTYDGNDAGVPYLAEAANFTAGGWRGEKLTFQYGLVAGSDAANEPYECVLTRVAAVAASDAGVETQSVSYQYLATAAGLVSGSYHEPSGTIESYGYGDSVQPLWQVHRRQDGGTAVPLTVKALSDGGGVPAGFGGYVLLDENLQSRWLVGAVNPDAGLNHCPPGRIGYPCDPFQDQVFTSSAVSPEQYLFMGDGTRTVAQVEHRFRLYGSQTSEATRRCVSGCPAAIGSAPQTARWAQGTGFIDDPVLNWSEDVSGTFTDYVYRAFDDEGWDTELLAIYSGATGPDAGSALAEQHFEYIYTDAGAGIRQLLRKSWAPTVVSGASGTSGVQSDYDAFNRLKSQIAFGKTVLIDGSVVDRYVGTFYEYNDESFGRVTAIKGPCRTESLTATGCSESTFPLKTLEYYPISNAANSGKLYRENSFPEGLLGSSLTTEFVEYDVRGRLLTQKDPNGSYTCTNYSSDRVASVRRGASSSCGDGEVTHSEYDVDGRLRRVVSPSGQYEIYCYRKNGGSSCSGGTLTNQVQWKGQGAADGGYAEVKEKIEYKYSASGVIEETTKDATGAIRTVRRYEADPFGRPTFDGWGDPSRSGKFSAARRFDSSDRLTQIGFAYNEPTAFCESSGNCAQLEHDRLGRLTSLIEYPSASAGQKTCLEYDAAGNLRRTASGYSPGDSCDELDVTITSYQYDDFGNLVAMVAPWATGGATRFEYDARGNLIEEKTPAMGATSVKYTYDQLGRLLKAASGTQVLFEYAYDDNGGTAPSGCTTTNTLGRLRRQLDSFGATWFSYDAFGRGVAEKRSRTPTGACTGGTPNDNPNGATTYLAGGRVGTITYPHGRVVTYAYSADLPERLESISSNAPFQPSVTLISGIQWEPYGGLRSYVAGTSPTSRVEYLQGDNGQATPGQPCSMPRPSEGTSDRTGRLRGLWVSASGGTSGDVYRRGYTWRADQVVQEDTCLLDELGQTVRYSPAGGSPGYDRRLYLTSVSRPAGEHQGDAGTGGSVGRRDYSYDVRGNRTADVHDCYSFANTYAVGSDRLVSRTSSESWCDKPATAYGVGFTYDQDGRTLTRSSPVGNGYSGKKNLIEFDWSLGAEATAATGSVFRSARINGMVYEYFYDAQGRRRIKEHPFGDKDEYFHRGGSLIEDRGVPDDFAASNENEFHPLDEYIWLAGRPVVMVRSLLDQVWARTTSTDCTRNQEYADCGTFFIVNDYLAKPVLMLDSTGKVAGVGDYDPFGHVNRVTVMGETPHPHAAQTNIALAHLRQPPLTKTDVQVRPRLALLDTESSSAGYVYLSGLDDLSFSTTCGGPFDADGGVSAPCGNWAPLSADGVAKIRFKSTSNAGNAYQGAVLEGYEFRRNQKNASRAWTPIRLPGQYYDEETDLFENWNRYYDPSVGRYLSPDPILLSPGAVVGTAASGQSIPTYVYASNNPINFSDPTGLASQEAEWAGVPNPWLNLDLVRAGRGPYGAEVFGGHFGWAVVNGGGGGGGGLNTPTLKILSALASGDVAAAQAAAIAIYGTVPNWFPRLTSAFNAANQVAGPCFKVADSIYKALRAMGNSPEIIQIRQIGPSTGGRVMGFQMPDGSWRQMSENSFHTAVRFGGRVYDAFTGAGGMPYAEYVNRIGTYTSQYTLVID